MFKFPVLLNWSDSCPLRCPFPFSSSKHMFSRTDPRDRSLWLPMILWLGLLWLQLLPISNSSWLFSSHCFSSSSQWMANTLEIFLCLNFRLLGRERGLTGATLPLWKLPETPGSENEWSLQISCWRMPLLYHWATIDRCKHTSSWANIRLHRPGAGLALCAKGCNSIDSTKRGHTHGSGSPWMSLSAGAGCFHLTRQGRGIQVGMAVCQTAFLIYLSCLCLGHQQGRRLCLDFSVRDNSIPNFFLTYTIQTNSAVMHEVQESVKKINFYQRGKKKKVNVWVHLPAVGATKLHFEFQVCYFVSLTLQHSDKLLLSHSFPFCPLAAETSSLFQAQG